ncbi:MAG TPA: hypothetical protein VNT26_17760 [Candidatus Sulfotelmatobacter sp.]|nr:hypothetical protein [Candidatus Sulfotelmatobacter sp.]HWI59948.1 hypothetical protein [Bacillota bacterium]
MKKLRALLQLIGLVIGLAVLHPGTAAACAVCYGEPDSPASRGLTWAIVALGSIVLAVLAGVVAFFVQANRKAALLAAAEPAGALEG